MVDGWRTVTLRDAAHWYSGGTPSTSRPEYWGGSIPWISAASLTDFYIRDSDRRVTDAGAAHGTRVVPAGTTIFVVRGMSLKSEFRVGITRRAVAFGQDCKALIPRDGIDKRFLAYAIKARTELILNMVDEAGHGTGRLPTDRMENLTIDVPSMDEQRAIAEVVGSLDDKIDTEQQIGPLCEALATSYLERIREVAPLRDFAEVVREQVRPQAFAGFAVAHFSLPAFDDGRLPDRGPGVTIKSNKFLLREPSVLVAKLNPHIPRVWFAVPPPSSLSVASTEFVVLWPKEPWSAELLWAACAAPSYIACLSSQVTGTTGSHQRVRPEDVLAAPVADLHEVSEAVREAVEALVRRAHAARDEVRRLAVLRDALLAPLLSGTLRVRDAGALVKEAS